ncbi:MAG TPA: hypothetical protein PKE69_17650 [Pyrinomonadaceae bacterium]|nr:hypothetical protein [Pyrinomonadaceae bacterium]
MNLEKTKIEVRNPQVKKETKKAFSRKGGSRQFEIKNVVFCSIGGEGGSGKYES